MVGPPGASVQALAHHLGLSVSRLLKYLRKEVFSSLLTQPWMAAPAKQARKRLIRREHVRTCAGRAN